MTAPESDLLRFPRPSMAVDVGVLTVTGVDDPSADALTLAVLVHRRSTPTHEGEWALPGSFVRDRERLNAAVLRTLRDKCGLGGLAPRLLGVFDAPDRDERGWVMSAVHLDTVPADVLAPAVAARDDLALAPVRSAPATPARPDPRSRPASALAADDQASSPESQLVLPDGQRTLPFDHEAIVELAVRDLRDRYETAPDPAGLLPEPFTLLQLRRVHEAVLAEPLQKDTFRRWAEPHLHRLNEYAEGVVGRPARLYRHRDATADRP